MEWVTVGILILLIEAIFGLIGNTLCLCVLLTKEMIKQPINLILFGLAVSDIFCLLGYSLVCLGVIIPDIKEVVSSDVILLPIIGLSFAGVMSHVAISQTSSIYHTVAISIDRFIVIRYPLHAKSICTRKRSILISSLIGLCSFLIFLPLIGPGFVWSILPSIKLPDFIVTFCGLYTEFLFEYGIFLLMFLLPWPGLLTLNLFIWKEIKNSSKSRLAVTSTTSASSKNIQENELKITRMLLMVVLVFGVCYTPFVVFQMLKSFFKTQYSDLIQNISIILVQLNSSVNFLIYFVMGQQFRTALGGLCICKLCQSLTSSTRETVISTRRRRTIEL